MRVFHTLGITRRCLLRWPFVNTLYPVASILHQRVETAGLCIGQSCLLRIGKERKEDHLEAYQVCVDIKARVEEGILSEYKKLYISASIPCVLYVICYGVFRLVVLINQIPRHFD